MKFMLQCYRVLALMVWILVGLGILMWILGGNIRVSFTVDGKQHIVELQRLLKDE